MQLFSMTKLGKLALALLALVVAFQVASGSDVSSQAATEKRGGRRRTSAGGGLVRNHARDNGEAEYDWICPQVVCRPLPASCSYVEFIVFDYSYEIQGHVVNVRCQSCPYCLDVPESDVRRRRRRSIYDLLGWSSQAQPCADIPCPDVPSGCSDVRQTNVLMKNMYCRQCAACYDNTLASRRPTL